MFTPRGEPADRSEVTLRLVSCLIVFSTIFISLRIYARVFLIKNPGLDDALAGVAYIVLMALGAVELASVQHGQGRQMALLSPADLKTFFALLPTQQLLYFAAIGFVRLSIVAFLPRLNDRPLYRRGVFLLGAILTIVTIIFFCLFMFQCRPVIALWYRTPTSVCISPAKQAVIMYTHAGLGVLFDLILLTAPLYVVYSNMIWSTQTFKVMLIFSVGVFAFIIGIVRLLVIVRTDMTQNLTYNVVTGAAMSDSEVHVILWVACFPTFQPIIRLLSFKAGLRSNASSTRPKTRSLPNVLSKLISSPRTNNGQERLGSLDGNKSTTHIVSEDEERLGGRENMEMCQIGEPKAGKDSIVKETHIEMHSSLHHGCSVKHYNVQ